MGWVMGQKKKLESDSSSQSARWIKVQVFIKKMPREDPVRARSLQKLLSSRFPLSSSNRLPLLCLWTKCGGSRSCLKRCWSFTFSLLDSLPTNLPGPLTWAKGRWALWWDLGQPLAQNPSWAPHSGHLRYKCEAQGTASHMAWEKVPTGVLHSAQACSWEPH